MDDKEAIKRQVAIINAKNERGEKLTADEERYIMKHVLNMSDEDIEFTLNQDDKPDGIVY